MEYIHLVKIHSRSSCEPDSLIARGLAMVSFTTPLLDQRVSIPEIPALISKQKCKHIHVEIENVGVCIIVPSGIPKQMYLINQYSRVLYWEGNNLEY